jgi:hypothetical protein
MLDVTAMNTFSHSLRAAALAALILPASAGNFTTRYRSQQSQFTPPPAVMECWLNREFHHPTGGWNRVCGNRRKLVPPILDGANMKVLSRRFAADPTSVSHWFRRANG